MKLYNPIFPIQSSPPQRLKRKTRNFKGAITCEVINILVQTFLCNYPRPTRSENCSEHISCGLEEGGRLIWEIRLKVGFFLVFLYIYVYVIFYGKCILRLYYYPSKILKKIPWIWKITGHTLQFKKKFLTLHSSLYRYKWGLEGLFFI